MPIQSRQIILHSRPEALPTADNFAFETVTLPDPGPNEIQVRNLFLSVDPYMRGRMRDVPSYVPPFQLGQPLEGGATGSNSPNFAPGDTVVSMLGWRESFNAPGDANNPAFTKVDATHIAPEVFLGAAGLTGFTAWGNSSNSAISYCKERSTFIFNSLRTRGIWLRIANQRFCVLRTRDLAASILLRVSFRTVAAATPILPSWAAFALSCDPGTPC